MDAEVVKSSGMRVTKFQIMAWTLPTEAGIYYMHDLAHTNPLEVGLGRNIKWDKDFIVKEALLEVKETGPAREMVGFEVLADDFYIRAKQHGGPGEAVFIDSGEEEVGRVSKMVYPGLIPGKTWVRVQETLEQNKSKAFRRPKSNELWYGNIYPSERPVKKDCEYAEALRKVAEEKERLLPSLATKLQKGIEQLLDAQMEAAVIAERDTFVMGFRLVVQILVDSLADPPITHP